MKLETTVIKPNVVRDMEKMAKAYSRILGGEYVAIQIDTTQYSNSSSGTIETKYSLYHESGGHQNFDDWPALVAEVRRRADGRYSK